MFFVFTFFVLGWAAYQPDVPLFVWSGENFLSSQNQQAHGYFTTRHVQSFTQALWNPMGKIDGLLPQINFERIPRGKATDIELVVFFLASSLSGEEISRQSNLLPTLASSMKESHSFYVPYMTESSSPYIRFSTWTAAENCKTSGGETYYMGPDTYIQKLERTVGTKANKINSFEELRSDNSLKFVNGKTDVLIVNLEVTNPEEKLKLIEQRLSELKTLFKESGFTKYVALLSGFKSSILDVIPSNKEMNVMEEAKRSVLEVLQTPPTSNSSFPQPPKAGYNNFNIYFNGVFWELFAVMVLFFGLIIFGVLQLLQVQSPDRVPASAQTKKK